ncbi:hypothetical protein [Polyangium aurulentum]|uniref:hypothetical protein n=1 Tax=Polyangium aurulentum TaxID=2567896 RepID=UPI0010AEC8A9|nr:hypothetical protein [Polyangium aurulentum]UQA62833.1 hypothetical protein E8A73_021225 [Polyangium aurulentum]
MNPKKPRKGKPLLLATVGLATASFVACEPASSGPVGNLRAPDPEPTAQPESGGPPDAAEPDASTTSSPGEDASAPDAGTSVPDAGSGTPDAGSGTPDAGRGDTVRKPVPPLPHPVGNLRTPPLPVGNLRAPTSK